MPHVLGPGEPRAHVVDRASELAIRGREGLALYEHVLVVGPQARVLERVLGATRLAGVLIGAVNRVLTDGVADRERQDHETEPAEDRRLAMPRAPTPGAGGKVARPIHKGYSRR